MSLLRLQEISLKFGKRTLFKEAMLSLENKERVCLIGRNGAGKTSLMRLIQGQIIADNGEIHRNDQLRIGTLNQSFEENNDISVKDYLLQGLAEQQKTIDYYLTLSEKLLDNSKDKQLLEEINQVQAKIDAGGGWDLNLQVKKIGDRFKLPLNKKLSQLSGGWIRRVSIAKVFVNNPNLLLLDEPTNHLDINSIDWLESILLNFTGCVLFITHDRTFLRNMANRIIEIDRGNLMSYPGNYENYLLKKEETNAIEDKELSLFYKRLAEEESWIRQGIKARRTRNEGRVRNLEKMRVESEQIVKRTGQVKIHIEEADISGRKIIEANKISFNYNDQNIINEFSIKISRGQKIGIVGNNGVGKTTLLRLLLGKIKPSQGTVKLGENLQISYLDQVENLLHSDKSIADNIGDDSMYVDIKGKPRHVVGYMKNFLFTPETILNKVSVLSGGEKNRVNLAKLLLKPSNVLILDEPTNDLDIELIDVIEQELAKYKGTLIIVSHDRDFLDKCVDQIIVFEKNGLFIHAGGYQHWKGKGRELQVTETLIDDNAPKILKKKLDKANKSVKKTNITIPKKVLTYEEKKELRFTINKIETLEKKIVKLTKQTTQTEFANQNYQEQKPLWDEIKSQQGELNQLMERWQVLEN